MAFSSVLMTNEPAVNQSNFVKQLLALQQHDQDAAAEKSLT